MKRFLLIAHVFLSFVIAPSFAIGSEAHGLPHFNLNDWPDVNRGKVPFPHNQHQIANIHCDTCHAIFPKRIGAIKNLIDNGVLAKKHVMNKLCVSCHKNNKQDGIKTGPTTCKSCHIK